ncbi:hypothetical protein [Stutzerimonas kirkiae]|uniref:Uncharacterized protein n=1 Tax=Stutzerimonas kirkiae TaxID=2211392 RepID=A0A4Q9RDD4_9GAMM|nr:hypothetical protein [Stutzerimonas kirkiae]TBU99364.1 hypothetical protein DNJ96_03400 [Stutzerimonas kirkiae]TBV04482.1 hypothetical protein DNK08_16920 [Stutzerimonas kirkiae]TBV06176.1 hypothetical protein DNJ95_00400 [Stutzerimonas kirkiae]
MYIGNAYPTTNTTYARPFSSVNTAQSTRQAEEGRTGAYTDRVSISDTARQAASAEASAASSTSSGEYPVEMYQVPDWMADYGFELSGQLGASASGFAERYSQAATATQEERSEYAERISGHYQAVLASNGIEGLEAHYQATILDQASSESLHQQMRERLQNDPGMLELMAKMGKSI